eukprot:symbB.v1.2.030299.t3/scaffold3332.1/size58911/4
MASVSKGGLPKQTSGSAMSKSKVSNSTKIEATASRTRNTSGGDSGVAQGGRMLIYCDGKNVTPRSLVPSHYQKIQGGDATNLDGILGGAALTAQEDEKPAVPEKMPPTAAEIKAKAPKQATLMKDELERSIDIVLGETETETLLSFPSLCVSLDNAQSTLVAARNKAYDELCASKADSDQYKEQHAQTMNQPHKSKEVFAAAPSQEHAEVNVTGWDIYDAFATAPVPKHEQIQQACEKESQAAVSVAVKKPGCLFTMQEPYPVYEVPKEVPKKSGNEGRRGMRSTGATSGTVRGGVSGGASVGVLGGDAVGSGGAMAAARGCDLDTAEKWFQLCQVDPERESEAETLAAGKIGVDQELCLRLLSCSLQSGNTSLAEEWIKRAVQAGAKTSEITMRIMKDMGALSDSAARRAFEAMIRQTAEAKELDAARRWYDQAIAAGLYPSSQTFAALLEAALSVGDADSADYWYQGVQATPGQAAIMSFNLLLDAVAQRGKVKLLGECFAKMMELGLDPTAETFRILVTGAAKEARDLDAATTWYQQSLDAGFKLNAGDYEELIDVALAKRDVKAAAFWYKSAKELSPLPTEVFNQLLSRAAQLEGFSMAASLFADLGGSITPNVETFNTMMLAAAKNGDTAAAEIWYARAQGAGCKPDALTYQALINAASKKGDLAAAEVWLRQAEEVGIKPTLKMLNLAWKFCAHTILNSMMAAASRDGDLQLAIGWFQRMDGFNLQPDVVSYTTIISAAAKSGNLPVAEEWFQAAVAQGITPNVVTFTSLIDAAVRSENDEAARHWYETSMKAGVQPSIRTFNTLMSGPARQGDLESAEKWFRTASFMGAIPDRVTYNTAAARAGDLASAESWFEKAVGARVDPNVVTFTTLISAAANQGRLQDAEAWFRKATTPGRDGPGIRPNVAMYNAVLSVAAKNAPAGAGGDNAAERWLQRMEDDGILADTRTFGILIDGSVKKGKKHDDITFRTLLNAAAKQGDLALAESWYAKASEHRRQPDIGTFNNLLQAAIRSEGIQAIRPWYDRAINASCIPDDATFSIAVLAAARAKNFTMVVEWLREASQQGVEVELIASRVLAKEVAQRAFRAMIQKVGTVLKGPGTMAQLFSFKLCHASAGATAETHGYPGVPPEAAVGEVTQLIPGQEEEAAATSKEIESDKIPWQVGAENPIPEEMAKSLRVMERIVSQNVFHRQHMIYRNYPTLEELARLDEIRMEEALGGTTGTSGFDAAMEAVAEEIAAAEPVVGAGLLEADAPDLGDEIGDDWIDDVAEEEDVDKPALQDLFCFDAPQLTQGMTVTCAEWNSNNKDLLAVSYGDTAPVPINPGGLVLFWSLKNPTYPERVIRTRQGVTTLHFSSIHPNMVAAGAHDGSVMIWDLRRPSDAPVLRSGSSVSSHNDQKHTDIVWETRWVDQGPDKQPKPFCSAQVRRPRCGATGTMGKFTIDPSLEAKMHQYQIVGRAAPTNKNPTPKIYRMRIFARNVVLAKSRFWYFMKRLNKAKKSGGELLAVNELFDKSPTKVKNYGIWLRYDSRTNTHNMYKEFRNININGAVGQLYQEGSGICIGMMSVVRDVTLDNEDGVCYKKRWLVVTVLIRDPFRSSMSDGPVLVVHSNPDCWLDRAEAATVADENCRREHVLEMHDKKLKFPIIRKVPHTIKKLRTTFKVGLCLPWLPPIHGRKLVFEQARRPNTFVR